MSTTRPPREWTIAELLPAGTACALVAKGGAGKSLLTLAAGIAIAAGYVQFAGLSIPKPRRVLWQLGGSSGRLAGRGRDGNLRVMVLAATRQAAEASATVRTARVVVRTECRSSTGVTGWDTPPTRAATRRTPPGDGGTQLW